MVDINDFAPIAHKASEDRAKLKATTTPVKSSPAAVQATSSNGPKALDQGEVKTPKRFNMLERLKTWFRGSNK